MLKNRQEGLIALHGFCITAILSGFYLAWTEFMQRAGFVRLLSDFNHELYLLAVIGGSLLSTRSYRRIDVRLGQQNWLEIIQITIRQLIRLAAVMFAVVFVTKDSHISRLFLGSFMGASAVLLLVLNCFLPGYLSELFFKDKVVRTLFVGSTKEINRLLEWVSSKAHLGVEPVGFLSNDADAAPVKNLPCLGTADQIDDILRTHKVGQVVSLQCYPDQATSDTIIHAAQSHGCRVRLYSNPSALYQRPVTIDHEDEYTFYSLDDEPLENPVNRLKKRLFDLAISIPVVLFVLPPLTIAVWIMQQIQAPGPIFYPQLRSGMNKRRFHIWKFRTMYVASQTKEQAVVQARKGDSRIYAFGSFLRRTSLDELPQFINVLIGDMSVAGPRPHMIEHDEKFAKLLHDYQLRHYVKPGITGLAQSKGFRGEISDVSLLEERIRYDLQYINKWSLLRDFKILIATARQVLFPPKTAY